MADGWAYFKAVYDTLPASITAMHEHNPHMLKHDTNLRGEAFASGALSSRDNDDLIVAVNVARLYAPAWPNSLGIFGWRIVAKANKPCCCPPKPWLWYCNCVAKPCREPCGSPTMWGWIDTIPNTDRTRSIAPSQSHHCSLPSKQQSRLGASCV